MKEKGVYVSGIFDNLDYHDGVEEFFNNGANDLSSPQMVVIQID